MQLLAFDWLVNWHISERLGAFIFFTIKNIFHTIFLNNQLLLLLLHVLNSLIVNVSCCLDLIVLLSQD